MTYKVKRLKSSQELKSATILLHNSIAEDFPYKPETKKEYLQIIYPEKFFRKFIKNRDHLLLGVFDKEKIVGLAATKLTEGGVYYLEWLITDKNYRGTGVGSLLLKKTEEWVLKNNGHSIYLYTEAEKNRDHFYPNRGFRLIGTFGNAWYGETEHMMAKSLRPNVSPKVFKAK